MTSHCKRSLKSDSFIYIFAFILITSATYIIKPAQSQSILGHQQHQQDPTIR
jgi:hypothetical protein